MENSNDWFDKEWKEIEARTNKVTKDLITIGKKLDALMVDISFWQLVIDTDKETAE